MAYVDKTAKCSQCGKTVHLIVSGRKADWTHPGSIPNPLHDAVPDPGTVEETGR